MQIAARCSSLEINGKQRKITAALLMFECLTAYLFIYNAQSTAFIILYYHVTHNNHKSSKHPSHGIF